MWHLIFCTLSFLSVAFSPRVLDEPASCLAGPDGGEEENANGCRCYQAITASYISI